MPVRRPSVAVSKVDDVPNGEIRDLATPDAGDKDDEDSRINSPAYMTDHCYARPVDEKSKQFENQFANDHGYSRYLRFFQEGWTLKPLAVNKSINLGPQTVKKFSLAQKKSYL